MSQVPQTSVKKLKSSLPPKRQVERVGAAGGAAGGPAAGGDVDPTGYSTRGSPEPMGGSSAETLPYMNATGAPQVLGLDAATTTGGGDLASDVTAGRHAMCLDILVSGYVQSFVDFFYLTHRPDPTPDPEGGGEREIDVAVSDMQFIQQNLTTAEMARRKGQTTTVYECYNNLAKYYQDQRDSKTGVYFYEKCLEIARLTEDALGEMNAHHNLGLAQESLGDIAAATSHHEKHAQLSVTHRNKPQEKVAHAELVKVYRAHAEALEKKSAYEEAIEAHARCLASAQTCNDRLAEGLANYRMGRVYVLVNQPAKAIPFLQNYLAITREIKGQEEGQGAAHAALAAAYQAMGDGAHATQELSQFLKIAESTDNMAAQAEACSNLGVIHNRNNEFDKAVQFFERAYELSRTLLAQGSGARKTVDNARVNLGMARGNAKMGTYLNVINYDLSALIVWKNKRVLPQGEAAGSATA